MLSSVLAQHHQKIILFVDRIGIEERHWKILAKSLLADLGAVQIHEDFLQITNELSDVKKSINFSDILKFPDGSWSIVLSSVAAVEQQYRLDDFFKLIPKLRSHSQVKHVVLYATEKFIREKVTVPFLEHMAEDIVTIERKNELNIVSRKPGGSVTKKSYRFSIEKTQILITEMKKEETQKIPESSVDLESLGTFKIGLSDKDLEARNRLILPFEKHLLEKKISPENKSAKKESQVIYYPEADDDIDEEDPDEDLEL
ncbi:hypothetical protein DMENIID0001_117520 [Sergentomyia squamirostris]